MGQSLNPGNFIVERRLRDAARGDAKAYYDLGICYSTGASGVGVDLVEAHKWFNLASVGGVTAAQEARADIAEEMSAREILVAQRAARDWIAASQRRAA